MDFLWKTAGTVTRENDRSKKIYFSLVFSLKSGILFEEQENVFSYHESIQKRKKRLAFEKGSCYDN